MRRAGAFIVYASHSKSQPDVHPRPQIKEDSIKKCLVRNKRKPFGVLSPTASIHHLNTQRLEIIHQSIINLSVHFFFWGKSD